MAICRTVASQCGARRGRRRRRASGERDEEGKGGGGGGTDLEDVRVDRHRLGPPEPEQQHAVGDLAPDALELDELLARGGDPAPARLDERRAVQRAQVLVRGLARRARSGDEVCGRRGDEGRAVAEAECTQEGFGRRGGEGFGRREREERGGGRAVGCGRRWLGCGGRDGRGGKVDARRVEGGRVRQGRAERRAQAVDHERDARDVVVGRADESGSVLSSSSV